MSRTGGRIAASVVALGVLGAVAMGLSNARTYEVSAVLPASDPLLIKGAPVYIDGFEVGQVAEIRPERNQAVVKVALDRDKAPLHAGANFFVQWKALVGERMLMIKDGPAGNAEVPDGGMIKGDFPKPTEVADILAALDPRTRKDLASLINRLNGTFEGSEADLNQTLRAAGPSLEAIGEVLRGIGTDGPAIEALVNDLNKMMNTLDKRGGDLSAIVNELSNSARTTAAHRDDLREALRKMPGTLNTARGTLDKVPGVTDKTLPLLKDLDPATARLADVAADMAPLMQDLRPMVDDLKPALRSAAELLDHTPGLLDSMDRTVPDITKLADGYTPALDFLRPYTPNVVHFLTTWGSANQGYDANGHYFRILAKMGTSSLGVMPKDTTPPGVKQLLEPKPWDGEKASGNNDADNKGVR